MVARARNFHTWFSKQRQRVRSARARTRATRERPHVESLEGRALLSLTFHDYPVPSGFAINSITAGPDGNVWFTDGPKLLGIDLIRYPDKAGNIGKITPDGTVTEFALPPQVSAGSIVAGPDGNLWFTEFLHAGTNPSSPSAVMIGRITPEGVRTDFAVPNVASAGPFGLPGVTSAGPITNGPDGNLWFMIDSSIDRITPSGQITSFPVHPGQNPALGDSIVTGPDGNLWFSEWSFGDSRIARMTPDGVVTEFAMPQNGVVAENLIVGPDGNLWFTEAVVASNGDPKVGRITPTGDITEFAPPTPNAAAGSISLGNDHDLWFTETMRFDPATGMSPPPKLVHLLPDGTMTEVDVPPNFSDGDNPNHLTLGPDGNLWLGQPELGFNSPPTEIIEAVLPPAPPSPVVPPTPQPEPALPPGPPVAVPPFVPVVLPTPQPLAKPTLPALPPKAPIISGVTSTNLPFHETAVTFTIQGNLTASSAQNVHNFLVVPVVSTGRTTHPVGKPVHVDAAVYNAASHTVTLFVHGWLDKRRVFQVVAMSSPTSGLVSPQGVHLAGNPARGPGSPYLGWIMPRYGRRH